MQKTCQDIRAWITLPPEMPFAPARPCRQFGCPNLQPCARHPKPAWARPYQSRQARGYDRRHDLFRPLVLQEEPWCRLCRQYASVVCDHIVPLARGGRTVRANLQGLCQRCSNRKTGREGQAARPQLRARGGAG